MHVLFRLHPAARRSRGLRGVTPALLAAALATVLAAGNAGAQGGDRVVIRIADQSAAPGEVELSVRPEPLVIARDHPEPPRWQLDASARGVARTFAVSFESGSPFVVAAGTSDAESTISLGPLRVPLELGSYSYIVRLFGEGGGIVAETRATVDVRKTHGLARRAVFVMWAIGVVLLLFNYLDTRPLTRSYDH